MKRLFVCLLLLMVSTSTLFAAEIPHLTSRVTDTARLLSADTAEKLNGIINRVK
jgi:uncharacterized membrane protein YgcG